MGLIYGTQNLNDDDYKQIYYEFQDCKRSKSEDLKKKFNKFCQNINNQLAKKFYADVDVAAYVKLVDENGKPILENTLKSNYNKKQNDIKLNITLHSDGRIEIKHEISPGYLSEYEEKWKKEAKARGMEVDITAMRQDIIKFLESEEAELSFGKEFLREIRTWYDESVGGYIEAIQATQKVIGNVWKEGTINQSTWFSKDDEHRQWPEYMHFNPIVGGATDGIIDEIVGLPMACKSVYELATDDEKRKALGKVFTKEGFSQMLEGLKKEYEELKKDEEKRGHFGGKTAVSIISMISGAGFISKAGKTDEFIDITEDVTKRIDDVPDIKLGHLDDIKNDKKILHNPENRKTINEFFESQNIKYIEELSEEIAEDIDLKNLAITNPKKFILGKKLENEISEKIRKELSEGSEEIIEKIAQNSGITFSELRGMQHMSQLQLKLPNGGFTVIDDVFVKEVKDIISNKTVGFELILSETKLSSLSPFTIRQNEFIKALQTNTTEFITRSKKSEAIDIFKQQGTKVTIKKYLKVIGDGSENISNIKIETIF